MEVLKKKDVRKGTEGRRRGIHGKKKTERRDKWFTKVNSPIETPFD